MQSPAGPDQKTLLQRNRDEVLARLFRAAQDAGRPSDELRLIAVTKTVEPEIALALAELGQRDLGENRAPELLRKAAFFEAHGVRVRWHFIGHLQRNKARRVAACAHAIHAVDSRALLETLLRLGREEGLSPELYLQVKLAPEETKFGLDPGEVAELVELAGAARGRLAGLMTMAPLAEPGAARAAAAAVFGRLAGLARELPQAAFLGGRPRLSMGMSGDLEEAVLAGADDVRIGSALFAGLERAA
jgi:hypothetical protein